MTITLAEWLGTRTAEQLAATLTARPEATAPPVPRHLGQLADRLQITHSLNHAMATLPTPAAQAVEVLALLGPDQGERAALASWLGREPGDPALTAALELLAERALAWPDGDLLRMPHPLYGIFRHPLGLGAPAATLLARYPVEHLRTVARGLGAGAHGTKSDLIATIEAALRDGDRVRALVAGASAPIRARLHELAESGPTTADQFAAWYGYQPPDPSLRWGAERGLVMLDHWGVPQLPREVAVALRGPDWHAPFTPQPVAAALNEVTGDAIAREAAAAAGTAVEQLTTLLEALAAAPVSLLKAGGLGVKELRRLARALRIDEATIRLWLELAYEAGLVGLVHHRSAPTELLPTPAYDDWLASEPADRLAALLPVWHELPAGMLPQPGSGDGKPVPALQRDHAGHAIAAVRAQALQFAGDLPLGHGAAGDGLAAAIAWAAPLSIGRYRNLDQLVDATWREAQLLGVVAHGALSPVGRALLDHARGIESDLPAACRALLPAATSETLFQADLTAVVPGTPTRSLAELLDAAADRESRGGAITWRFTPGSVRRALDAGHAPDGLLAALRAHATGGTLPQPLEYLVGDVARRHGAVRVRAVACVLRADDPALVAELAGARALRALELSVIAPTVLGSAQPVAETLTALRAAGYAPVGESAEGVAQVERADRRRAGARKPVRPGGRPAPPTPEPVDPRALANRLLTTPVPEPEPDPEPPEWEPSGFEADLTTHQPLDLAGELDAHADQLDPDERRLLAHAIQTAAPVTISYTNAQGSHSVRVIDSAELDGGLLIAWCRLRDDERIFALHRIDSVGPAS